MPMQQSQMAHGVGAQIKLSIWHWNIGFQIAIVNAQDKQTVVGSVEDIPTYTFGLFMSSDSNC